MAHHGSTPFDGLVPDEGNRVASFFRDIPVSPEFGKTGSFPEGKLRTNDEGEIQFGIAQTDGKVVINFGTPVVWVGFSPEQAREIALSLTGKAHEIDGK